MPKEKSAGAIIFRKEENKIYYLLLHYQSGHWDFPKGHIEKGESDEQTIKREIEEETGIKDIKIIPGFKEYIKYFFKKSYGLKGEARKKAPFVFKIVVFYLAETKTKDIKISFEHIGYKWLEYEDALKQLTFKNAKEILKKAQHWILTKIFNVI
jgi:8-oxo-dGTP pyrophosphatase MutT (NUDIX family)